MASTNFKLFDENKTNMMSDTEYNINTQRINGVQAGIASSQLQNKTLYQTSLVAYSLAQIMMQNGYDANDSAAVSDFVGNMSNSLLQKVLDKATSVEAQNGVNNTKWMSPALTKAAIDILAAKAQNILSDETKTLLGLPNTAVPDDAFVSLVIGVNKYAFRLTFTFLDDSPVSGKTVNGLTSLDGTPVVTDENGNAFGVSSTQTVEIGMDFTEYIDIENFRTTLTATAKITDFTIKISSISTTSKTITTSGQYKFSPNVEDYDVAAIGGGGGGAYAPAGQGGGGGGGGSVANLFAQSTKTLTVQIGSTGNSGSDGGSTVISEINLTAEGGKAGSEHSGGYSLNGGSGGNGYYYLYNTQHHAQTGNTRSVYPFNDSSILSGGGGGGGDSSQTSGASGGSPFGGKGGDGTDSPTSGQSATGFGGGGGGGGSHGYSTLSGGDGYQGAVMFRWRLIAS